MAKPKQSQHLASGESIFVEELNLRAAGSHWPFAEQYRVAIDEHWSKSVAVNPHIFNGTIYPLLDHVIGDNWFRGDYGKSDFASYLYWREMGFGDPPTCDGFASVMLRSVDGRYLFAKAAEYTLNSGLWVPPGGMIDERDVDRDGSIDVWRYGLRELAEETALAPQDVMIEPGYQVARDGALIAYGLFCQSRPSEDEIFARFQQHNNNLQNKPELDELRWFSVDEALSDESVPKFVKLLFDGWARKDGR